MQNQVKTALIILSMTTLICSCGSGGGSDSVAGAGKPVKISASQIVFSGNKGVQLAALSDGVVDPNIKVLAENVTIDTSSNALRSDNLQDALDKEMAINLPKVLAGKTWKITNRTSDPVHTGTTGVVKINDDGSMTLVSGYFAAIGQVHGSETNGFAASCDIPQIINFEFMSDSVIYVTSQVKSRFDSAVRNNDSIVKVVSKSTDRIVVTGSGGCGAQGVERLSVLTPMEATATTGKRSTKGLGTI